MREYTSQQIILFIEIEQEVIGDELAIAANIAAVGAGTGMSGNTDGLRRMIAGFQGTDAMQGDAEVHNRLESFLSKKRRDAD